MISVFYNANFKQRQVAMLKDAYDIIDTRHQLTPDKMYTIW